MWNQHTTNLFGGVLEILRGNISVQPIIMRKRSFGVSLIFFRECSSLISMSIMISHDDGWWLFQMFFQIIWIFISLGQAVQEYYISFSYWFNIRYFFLKFSVIWYILPDYISKGIHIPSLKTRLPPYSNIQISYIIVYFECMSELMRILMTHMFRLYLYFSFNRIWRNEQNYFARGKEIHSEFANLHIKNKLHFFFQFKSIFLVFPSSNLVYQSGWSLFSSNLILFLPKYK